MGEEATAIKPCQVLLDKVHVAFIKVSTEPGGRWTVRLLLVLLLLLLGFVNRSSSVYTRPSGVDLCAGPHVFFLSSLLFPNSLSQKGTYCHVCYTLPNASKNHSLNTLQFIFRHLQSRTSRTGSPTSEVRREFLLPSA